MCGIVGYVGNRPAQNILLNGLKRLEYRGYDSSGISVINSDNNKISTQKSPGKIAILEGLLKKKPLGGSIGIAHSRWATHGAPNHINAHPHADCKKEISIVHNGIIENYESLKTSLIKEGHRFLSQTDTEVIVHLIEKFYKNNISLEEAVRKSLKLLVGSFAIGVISSREPDKLVGARLGSPLIVGVGKNENFLASDVPAILDSTKEVIFLEENEMAVLNRDSVRISGLNGKEVFRDPEHISWDITQAQKRGYKHFMLKEINEQPGIIENILKMRIRGEAQVILEELKISQAILKKIKNITIVACGTAYHAGMVGKYIIESICSIPVSVDVSSEFRYRNLLLDKDTLVTAVSQSGETADTLAGVKEARERGARVLSICNVLGSSLTRESDGVIYTHAGPEMGVASTKAYTAQLMAFYFLAFYLAELRGVLPREKIAQALLGLKKIPHHQQEILKNQAAIAILARRYSHLGSFLYLGRQINYPSALEGALKLKEISYIPAEGYAAGEMKHGPIALIDEYRAVVCISPDSQVYEKMVSNIQEILARQGKIIAIASLGDEKLKEQVKEIIYIPKCPEIFSPLLVVLPLQLIAYHIAVKRGCDVDQPRNLAKSVTVE